MHSELTSGLRKHWPPTVHTRICYIDQISTMSTSRVYAIFEAIDHVDRRNIPGDIVECGVYMGGNIALFACDVWDRGLNKQIWAYDTFSGVPASELEPIDTEMVTERPAGTSLIERYENDRWCSCTQWQVGFNVNNAVSGIYEGMDGVSAVTSNIRYVAGSVLETIPGEMPDAISFLRLDMDIAKPTKHVLEHAWPRIPIGGVIHVDDYHSFSGVHQVVRDFFSDKFVYMQEIDYTSISIVRIA